MSKATFECQQVNQISIDDPEGELTLDIQVTVEVLDNEVRTHCIKTGGHEYKQIILNRQIYLNKEMADKAFQIKIHGFGKGPWKEIPNND